MDCKSGDLVELRGVSRVFKRGSTSVAALQGVSLGVAAGEFVAIMGPSGSGKSTLLGILGCLDEPTSGEYRLDGHPVQQLSDRQLSRVRNRSIGFVFQAFHLLPQLSLLENVLTPLVYSDLPHEEWRGRARRCLSLVGLEQRADHRPAELSGGEAQRGAIARALVMDPRLLLADEPTGNLDSVTGAEIADVLSGLHEAGRTLVLVTHNEALARRAQRVVRLSDGRVV